MQASMQLARGKFGGFRTRSSRTALDPVCSYPVSSRHGLAAYFKVRCLKKRKLLSGVMLLLSLIASGRPSMAGPASVKAAKECAQLLPTGLAESLGSMFAEARVVTLRELDAEARAHFVAGVNGSQRCPGIVQLDFFGNKTTAFGILLVKGKAQQRRARLVLASQTEGSPAWRVETLLTEEDADIPYLVKEAAGEYEDVYGEEKIQTMGEALVWVDWGTVAILFGWTGAKVEKVWLRD
jgi:hypothetical protein